MPLRFGLFDINKSASPMQNFLQIINFYQNLKLSLIHILRKYDGYIIIFNHHIYMYKYIKLYLLSLTALILRNLDALTTEDEVMATLSTTIPNLVKSVSAVCIGRDPLTSTSRGLCYLGTESTIDALAIHGALNNLKTPLTIDGKTGKRTFYKYYTFPHNIIRNMNLEIILYFLFVFLFMYQ